MESKIITSRINDDGTSAFVDVSVFGCGGESKSAPDCRPMLQSASTVSRDLTHVQDTFAIMTMMWKKKGDKEWN